MFDRFDDGARRAIVMAQELARARPAPVVEADDLLIALLADEDGAPAGALRRAGVEPGPLAAAVVATVAEPPDGAPEVSGPIPWSDAAKAALDATGHLVLVEPRGERVGAELGRFSRKGR